MKMTHLRIDFGFEAEIDLNGRLILRDERSEATKIILHGAGRIFGFYTVMQSRVGWTNPAGMMVAEDGMALFVILPCEEGLEAQYDAQITELASVIKDSLKQEMVAITRTRVNFELQ